MRPAGRMYAAPTIGESKLPNRRGDPVGRPCGQNNDNRGFDKRVNHRLTPTHNRKPGRRGVSHTPAHGSTAMFVIPKNGSMQLTPTDARFT